MIAGELIVKMKAESAAFSTQMEQNRRTVERTHQSVINFGEHGSRGFRKVENAAASLGLGMLGLHGKSETLISGLLLMGAGGQATLLITAGIAAIALAYESLGSTMSKVRDEQNKLIEAANKRVDPNTGIFAEAGAASKAVTDIEHKIRDLQSRTSVQQGLDPFGIFGGTKKLENLKGQLAAAKALVDELKPLVAKQWASDHPKEPPLMGPGQEDWVKNALQVIDLAQSKLGTSTAWADLAKKQGKSYTDALGLAIDAGFSKNQDFIGKIERPAIFEKMELDAKLWEETWKNAVRGTQQAFADFFDSIGQQGFRLISLLENVARAVRRTIAEWAAQKVVNGLLGGFSGGGGGIPSAPGMGSIGDNPIPSISPSTARTSSGVNLHINYAPQTSALDATGVDQVLAMHGHKFVLKTMQAFADNPALARYVVAQGMRP